MRNNRFTRRFAFLLVLLTLLAVFTGGFAAKKNNEPVEEVVDPIIVYALDYDVQEDGWYTTKEEVAIYLTLFQRLPDNFISKRDAEDLGWVSSWGNLDEVAPGCSIGGSHFGNYEGLLPKEDGRKYTECDIDFDGTYRNAKRIVFSNDGLIFYTEDHYESFVEIYVELELENPDKLEQLDEVEEDEAA